MASILIIYQTTDGHTREICLRLQKTLEQQAHDVSVHAVDEAVSLDLASYDKIVIGASIRYGKHSELVYDFIKRNQPLLDDRPNAFFSVNLVARKPHRRSPDTNPYLKKFLKQISWQPGHVTVFAGKLNYPIYSFSDRLIIRMIMWITGGPTDPTAVVEFTDWQQVEAFADKISNM